MDTEALGIELAAQAFLIEVLLANFMASLPDDRQKAMRVELSRLSALGANTSDPDPHDRRHALIAEAVERVLARTAGRLPARRAPPGA